MRTLLLPGLVKEKSDEEAEHGGCVGGVGVDSSGEEAHEEDTQEGDQQTLFGSGESSSDREVVKGGSGKDAERDDATGDRFSERHGGPRFWGIRQRRVYEVRTRWDGLTRQDSRGSGNWSSRSKRFGKGAGRGSDPQPSGRDCTAGLGLWVSCFDAF